jgi:hypothetical protein
MPKRHIVVLPPESRATLQTLISAGTAPARAQTRARILLKADVGPAGPGWTDGAIATALETSGRTVARVRRDWATQGLAGAVTRKRPVTRTPRKLDGDGEARVIAVACSAPPEGHPRWTLRMLAAKLVELEVVDGIAPNTVRATLKKTISNPG